MTDLVTTTPEPAVLDTTEAPSTPSPLANASEADRTAAAVAKLQALAQRLQGDAAPAPGIAAAAPTDATTKPVEPPPADIEAVIRQRAAERAAKQATAAAPPELAQLVAKVQELEARLATPAPAKPDAAAFATTPIAALKAMGLEIDARAFLRAATQEVLNPSAANVRAEMEKRLAQLQPAQQPAVDPAAVARQVYQQEQARAKGEAEFVGLVTPDAFPTIAKLPPAKLLERAYAVIDEFGADAFAADTPAESDRLILQVIEQRQRKLLAELTGGDQPPTPPTAMSGKPPATPTRRATTITSDLATAGGQRRPLSPREREAAARALAEQQMARR